jgi:hypothetical protein
MLTALNTIAELDGSRRCRECREQYLHRRLRRNHAPLPSISGTCRSGLHPWIEQNITVDKHGVARCRPCRLAAYRAQYKRVGAIKCVVSGCKRQTTRTGGGSYICLRHRQNPPKWIESAGLRIVGTRLEAA